MAREAYRSLYGDLTKLKDLSLANDPAAGTGADTELWQLLMQCSEWVDRYCNRHFAPITTTKLFDGNGQREIIVPDLLAITTLKEDDNNDKTFETTWATTDYWLQPYNAEPTKAWGFPYSSLATRKTGTKATFKDGEQTFEIVGRWGYREFKEDSNSNVNEAVSPLSATDTTLTATTGSDFAIGQTIIIETEQLLITNISANDLTVVRAMNGTTAASHANTTDIYIIRWPLSIERATLITAARIWTRAPSFEPAFVDSDVDTDIALMLETYRRLGA